MQKHPYRAIIFDLYGVLALNGWQAFKARHFRDRPEVWDEIYDVGKQVDAGLAEYKDFIQMVAERSGESEATVRYQLEHTAPNEELLAYIADELLGKYKLGILSNAGRDHVLEEIFTKQQREYFDVITLSHHFGLTKPDTRIYEATASLLELNTNQCVFVDDQERHVSGAKEAGMLGIVFTGVANLQQELARL